MNDDYVWNWSKNTDKRRNIANRKSSTASDEQFAGQGKGRRGSDARNNVAGRAMRLPEWSSKG